MKCPAHLSHKPIVSVDDYEKIDGMYAGKSDAKVLSIGFAQYDVNSVAAKVFVKQAKHMSYFGRSV